MAFIGNQPTAVPLTSSQLADGLITSAKIATGAVENVDIASNTINLTQKVTGTLPFANGGTGLSTLGTAGQALIVNSSATALSYATVGATAGQVIQVVTGTDSTERTTNSASFITGSNTLSATITPSSASNKIFAICSFNCGIYVASDTRNMIFTIFRDATDLGAGSSVGMSSIRANLNGAGAYDIAQPVCISVLDSPSTTSAITYQLYYRRTDNNYDITLNAGSRKGSMTLFEIKG